MYFDVYQSIHYSIKLRSITLHYITLYYYIILHYIKHTTLYIETPSEIFSIHIHNYTCLVRKWNNHQTSSPLLSRFSRSPFLLVRKWMNIVIGHRIQGHHPVFAEETPRQLVVPEQGGRKLPISTSLPSCPQCPLSMVQTDSNLNL